MQMESYKKNSSEKTQKHIEDINFVQNAFLTYIPSHTMTRELPGRNEKDTSMP